MAPMVDGDWDLDGDTDLDDFSLMKVCLAGPDEHDVPNGCPETVFEAADVDEDSDVDLREVAAFWAFFGG